MSLAGLSECAARRIFSTGKMPGGRYDFKMRLAIGKPMI